jgi:solute carrier family 45 protein 1/2/4
MIALLSLYVLNASIQPLQGGSRAFLFDNTCQARQSVAAAWASRANSFVNVFMYFLGNIDLPRLLPFLGSTQARALASLAVAGNAIGLTIACLTIEDHPSPAREAGFSSTGFGNVVKELISTARHLPWRIKEVMLVQAWSWLGWTPFLFYMSSYVPCHSCFLPLSYAQNRTDLRSFLPLQTHQRDM